MSASFANAIYKGRGQDIIKKFNPEFRKNAIRLKQKMEYDKIALESAYEDMKIAFGKSNLTKMALKDSIITQIYNIINKIESGDEDFYSESFNLYKLLSDAGVDVEYIDADEKLGAIEAFISQYFETKDSSLSGQEFLNNSTKNLKGGETYYTILLQGVADKETGQKMDRLLQITASDYFKFEEANSDLFELGMSSYKPKKGSELSANGEREYFGSEGSVQKYGLRLDVRAQQVYDRMKETFSKQSSTDLLDSIFAVNSKDKTAIKTREIWNVLMKDVDDNTDATKGKIGNFANLGGGRRLEILFDSRVRSEVSNMMENGTLTKQNLVNYFNNLDISKYKKSENVYGHAAGDTSFNFGNGDEFWQLKFKSKYGGPWNGAGYSGSIEAIDNVINLCNVVERNPDAILNIGKNGGAMFPSEADVARYFSQDPRAVDSLQEMAVEYVNDNYLNQDWTGWNEVSLGELSEMGEVEVPF